MGMRAAGTGLWIMTMPSMTRRRERCCIPGRNSMVRIPNIIPIIIISLNPRLRQTIFFSQRNLCTYFIMAELGADWETSGMRTDVGLMGREVVCVAFCVEAAGARAGVGAFNRDAVIVP